jgi:hypothetical protein
MNKEIVTVIENPRYKEAPFEESLIYHSNVPECKRVKSKYPRRYEGPNWKNQIPPFLKLFSDGSTEESF